MSLCNHNPNDNGHSLIFSKKFLGVYPRIYVSHCKECKQIVKFIKENDNYKEVK